MHCFSIGLEVGMVEKDAVSKDFRKQVLGYGLTTAEIVYRRPDRHWLLQTYVWQDYDMFPNFPALKDFLAFWEKSARRPAVRSHRRAFETHQARRTARRRWRVSVALIQLEQLRRQREKLKIRISAPEHIQRMPNQERFQPLNNPDVGETITQKTRLWDAGAETRPFEVVWSRQLEAKGGRLRENERYRQ